MGVRGNDGQTQPQRIFFMCWNLYLNLSDTRIWKLQVGFDVGSLQVGEWTKVYHGPYMGSMIRLHDSLTTDQCMYMHNIDITYFILHIAS